MLPARPTLPHVHRHGSMMVYRPGQRLASTPCRAAGGPSDGSKNEDAIWAELAFPFYLQQANQHNPDVCKEFDKALQAAESGGSVRDQRVPDVWHAIRSEAERDAAEEPLLSSFLYASILAHDSFERALAFVLSNRLASAVMLPTQLFEIFHEVLTSDAEVREGALADVEACRERDPACRSYSQALLYYKGYHALQTHRIAHALWCRGQRVMAVALQSRVSEVLAVDIHPAARLGRGILLDHGTGVVIGETAVIGNNVSLLQNVTLGGTGKEVGDRHPKISDNVLIGASATVLGNIVVGRGAQIAAGSLVLKAVPPHTMVAGSPAKPVGKLFGNPALDMQQWSRKFNDYDPLNDDCLDVGAPNTSSSSTSSSTTNNTSGYAGMQSPSSKAVPSTSSSNGTSAGALGGGNGKAAAAAGVSTSQASVAWDGKSVNGTVYHGNGHRNGTSYSKPHVTVHMHEHHPAEEDKPAPLRGVYEGSVDATLDEEAAMVLWPVREDPEYVI